MLYSCIRPVVVFTCPLEMSRGHPRLLNFNTLPSSVLWRAVALICEGTLGPGNRRNPIPSHALLRTAAPASLIAATRPDLRCPRAAAFSGSGRRAGETGPVPAPLPHPSPRKQVACAPARTHTWERTMRDSRISSLLLPYVCMLDPRDSSMPLEDSRIYNISVQIVSATMK